MNQYVPLIYRFIIALLLQVTLFNFLPISTVAFPAFYLYFILTVPVGFYPVITLLLAFMIGISVDFSLSSFGLHSFASVFTAYVRGKLLKLMQPYDGYLPSEVPTFETRGMKWWLYHTSFLIFIHMSVLSFLEIFQIGYLFTALFKSLLSTLYTLGVILIWLLLPFLYKKRT